VHKGQSVGEIYAGRSLCGSCASSRFCGSVNGGPVS